MCGMFANHCMWCIKELNKDLFNIVNRVAAGQAAHLFCWWV